MCQKDKVRLAQVKGRRVVWARCVKKRKLDWLKSRVGWLFGQGMQKNEEAAFVTSGLSTKAQKKSIW